MSECTRSREYVGGHNYYPSKSSPQSEVHGQEKPSMAIQLRTVLMLARRSCHWGPIIALSLVTIVTASSTYCLFQLAVLPKVVVLKTFHNVICYTWIVLILKNFFQVCTCVVCIFSVDSRQMSCWVRH